jgi:hypothetical protein
MQVENVTDFIWSADKLWRLDNERDFVGKRLLKIDLFLEFLESVCEVGKVTFWSLWKVFTVCTLRILCVLCVLCGFMKSIWWLAR